MASVCGYAYCNFCSECFYNDIYTDIIHSNMVCNIFSDILNNCDDLKDYIFNCREFKKDVVEYHLDLWAGCSHSICYSCLKFNCLNYLKDYRNIEKAEYIPVFKKCLGRVMSFSCKDCSKIKKISKVRATVSSIMESKIPFTHSELMDKFKYLYELLEFPSKNN